ncbi:hypothetical protein EEAAV_09445 [Rahnella aceris]
MFSLFLQQALRRPIVDVIAETVLSMVSVRRVRERDLLHWCVTIQLPVHRLRRSRGRVVTERVSWLPER